jgi:DNA modification methylase
MIKLINADYKDIKFTKHKVDLFVIDPPYSGIIKDKYDKISKEDLIKELYSLLNWIEQHANDGATIYLFGGVGKPKNRPFLKFISEFEENTNFVLHNFLTWKKKRGYGTQYNYLFTREEIAMIIYNAKRPKIFNVPYLDEERSDEWKKTLKKREKNRQPKSTKLRRSNVFADINEIFQGHLVTAQKPAKLIEVLVETSSNKGSLVVDPMTGSGTTGVICQKLERNCICIEKDSETFKIMEKRVEAT